MDFKIFLQGVPAELDEVLAAREKRMLCQQRLLKQYRCPVISFSLNIAGPIKVFLLAQKSYEEGLELILYQCKTAGIPILETVQTKAHTGWECCMAAKGDAAKIKRVLTRLEEGSSLGRLFDIDVIDTDGQKLSRTDRGAQGRCCLICDKPAFVCGRSRTHTVEQLQERTVTVMWDYFVHRYAQLVASSACRALLYEVLATPKPGLVDKANNGAHQDMDIATFESSALALLPYFTAFVQYGIDHCEKEPALLLEGLRQLGLDAELAMLRATGGVNTHKGIIFSMGILQAALGVCCGKNTPADRKTLQALCAAIAAPLLTEMKQITLNTATTGGERLLAQNKIKGARGEAAAGFPVLFEVGLPAMDAFCNQGYSQNDAGVLTLLKILSVAQDTNVVVRSDLDTMYALQKMLQKKLPLAIKQNVWLELAQEMDKEFIKKNISPGGSADILALTYFVRVLEKDGLMKF